MGFRFRLKAFAVHVAGSAAALTLVLGALWLGWYRWPGWYLTQVTDVAGIMVGVDVCLGPLLTFLVANPRKPRSELTRDIGIIVACQLVALAYGSASLWQGRPLYYAFSVNQIQLVQASDIHADAWRAGQHDNPALAPHWYSTPRYIWAPLPEDPQAAAKLLGNVVNGSGDDVTQTPRAFRPWDAAAGEIRKRLGPARDSIYFSRGQRQRLEARLVQLGYGADAPTLPVTGRGRPLLAVLDPRTLSVRAIVRPS